ncbi:contact-dependent growth inhibition system immunity protein [Streptomyces sp. NPDC020807]|uniref:contact-dependent growth inhibition system immunity protein n=1 Tax=Streptomyces sp. NPDC020807 TaxID=3155119 RepID=UPI003402C63B
MEGVRACHAERSLAFGGDHRPATESFDAERVPHCHFLPEPVIEVEKLQYLAQAYFHQDYDLETEDPIQILTEFRDSEPPELVEELRIAIERVLSSGPREEELAALWLDRAEACYDPRQDGMEMSVWFRRMIDALL